MTITGGTVVGSDGMNPITVENPTVSGGGTFGIVTDRPMPAGGTDTYTIVLNASVPADFDPALGECIENTPGSGFYNLSDATSGEDSFTDHDCGSIPQIPNPTVTKTVVGVPVQSADGAWTVTYDVVAANPDATLGTLYDLTDTLAFGAGITVTSATVTGPAGVTVNPGWNGASDTSVIVGRFLAAGASETYRVVVTATVASDATRTCDTGGFRNNSHVDLVVPTPPGPPPGLRTASWAFLAAAAATQDATACAEPVSPTVTKTVASVTPGTAQGTFVVAYDVTVSNPSTTTGVSYDLTDTPAFPAQVTISQPTASVVRSNLDGSGAGASTAIDGWVSGGPLATGTALPAGMKDTYRVSVLVTVPAGIPTTVLECSGSTSEHGFFNAARMTSGEDVYDVNACAPIPPPAPPTTPTTPTTPPLPNTGFDVGGIGMVALLLFGAGALLLVLTSRRRRGIH